MSELLSSCSENPNKISLSACVTIVIPPDQPVVSSDDEDDEVNDIVYYTTLESDKYRHKWQKFFHYTDITTGIPYEMIPIKRSDKKYDDKNVVSMHAIPKDDSTDLKKSDYTCLTIAIGYDRNNKKIYFNVNPKEIALSMEYCRNSDYVCWGAFKKYEFDNANYEECVQIVVEKTKVFQKLLSNDYKNKLFNPHSFYPVMVIKYSELVRVILVLKKLGDGTTITNPYAMKLQKFPPVEKAFHKHQKQSILYEPYLNSILGHPNVLRIFDNFVSKNDWKIQLFELCPYGTLDNLFHGLHDGDSDETLINLLIKLHNPTRNFEPIKLIKYYSAQILMALEYLHELGIMHFDIKPSHVAIGYRGYAKIYDFSLSYHKRDIKYNHEGLNFTIYGCKEKKNSVNGETTIGLGTDIYGFSVIIHELFASLLLNKRIGRYKLAEEEKLIKKKLESEKLSGNVDLEYDKQRFELGTQLVKELFGCIEVMVEARSEETEIQDIYQVLKNSFHYDDYQNRMNAKELLELKFYNSIDKEKLFKQELNLEEELNYDLRDLFSIDCFYIHRNINNNTRNEEILGEILCEEQ